MYVGNDEHEAFHRRGALQLLRRFRRKPMLYSTLITAPIVQKLGVTPSHTIGQKPKHKKSTYTYRYTRFHVARFDKVNAVLSIRKTEERSLLSSAAGSGAGTAPASAPVLTIECQLCGQACAGVMGIQRH